MCVCVYVSACVLVSVCDAKIILTGQVACAMHTASLRLCPYCNKVQNFLLPTLHNTQHEEMNL